jgi:uncharacterized protein (UPF0261 family)
VTAATDPVPGWSHQQGVDYEIAQDTLTQLIAFAGRRIDQLQQPGAADTVELAAWQTRREEWAQRRLDLTPTNVTAVQHVLTTDADLLRAFHDGAK